MEKELSKTFRIGIAGDFSCEIKCSKKFALPSIEFSFLKGMIVLN